MAEELVAAAEDGTGPPPETGANGDSSSDGPDEDEKEAARQQAKQAAKDEGRVQRPARFSNACPPIDELYCFARGIDPGPARVEHIRMCPDCSRFIVVEAALSPIDLELTCEQVIPADDRHGVGCKKRHPLLAAGAFPRLVEAAAGNWGSVLTAVQNWWPYFR